MKVNKLLLVFVVLSAIFLTISCNSDNDNNSAKPDKSLTQGIKASVKHYKSFENAEALERFFHWAPGRVPTLAAHRGGPLPGYPENCLETFDNILRYEFCMIECDVRKTKDGALVMLHDKELDNTTTGKGLLGDYTLAQVKALKLTCRDGQVSDFHMPTLEETLEWARGKTILELDVKKPVTFEEVVAMVEKHKAESYSVIITYNLDSAKKVHHLNPSLMISASAKGVEGTKRLLASGINPHKLLGFVGVTAAPKEVYEMLHKKKTCSILGTLSNLDRKALKKGYPLYVEFMKQGVDIFATDNVPLVARALHEYCAKK